MICSFIVYWAGLFKDEMEAQIVQRAGVIKEAALLFHRKDAEGICTHVRYRRPVKI
jgi:hypothetical protein